MCMRPYTCPHTCRRAARRCSVSLHTCLYTCLRMPTYMSAHMSARSSSVLLVSAHMPVHMSAHAYIHVRTHVHTHACAQLVRARHVYTHMSVRMSIRTSAHMSAHMSTRSCELVRARPAPICPARIIAAFRDTRRHRRRRVQCHVHGARAGHFVLSGRLDESLRMARWRRVELVPARASFARMPVRMQLRARDGPSVRGVHRSAPRAWRPRRSLLRP